tara:strand:+ start:2730 stop:2987 length:258 start_codon:yes stop_codon:yes gene_type:complete
MIICEHEKNIECLVKEFGNSCTEDEIRKWYITKRNYIENKDDFLPNSSHIVTYISLKEDLDLSFPDNVPRKSYYSIKSYKNEINS